MAVNKQELLGELTLEQAREVAEIEALIDRALLREYMGSSKFYVLLAKHPSNRVMREVTRLFHLAGWTVDFYENNNKGSTVILS